MQRAALYSAFSREWETFLHTAGLVYSKLGEGAVGCGVSTNWIARKRQDRKADPLLQYVHQARNGEEHGLEPSIEHAYRVVVTPGVMEEYFARFEPNGDMILLNSDMEPAAKSLPLTGALRSVTNSKFGDVFPPPTMHLGLLLGEPSAFEVARLAISYLEGLITEATQLPQRP
jgi:hypothetical protein